MREFALGFSFSAAVLSLAVGGPARGADTPPLRVATFRCDVTPPIGGHPIIWVTPITTVESPLLAKGIVLDDGKSRYAICAVDWCGLSNSSHTLFRRKIAAAAGTDVSRVAVHCVHQHTAPYTDGDAQKLLDAVEKPPRYVDFRFMEEVTDRLAAAVEQAMQHWQPFDRVGIGQAKVDRVGSSRRIPTGDGKVRSRMSSAKDPALRALPEGNIDPMLKTVTLAMGDKPLVRMHYYATHPQAFYGDPRASSDCVGFARERLQQKEFVFQVYFTGCGGNVALGKYNDGTVKARHEITERLLAGMEASVAATEWAPAGTIAWRSTAIVLPARTDPRYTEAEQRAKMADPKLKDVARTRAATFLAYTLREKQPLDLAALTLGPARILHLPGEACVEFQQYAQSLLPGQFVAVAAYGDTGPGYICIERAFGEGGYEPTATCVVPQSEGILKAAIAELLGAGPVPAAKGP